MPNRTSSPSELCSVKVTKRSVVIPENETVVVTCSVNTGPIESGLPVLFEPDIESPWPAGLVFPETLVNLKGVFVTRWYPSGKYYRA